METLELSLNSLRHQFQAHLVPEGCSDETPSDQGQSVSSRGDNLDSNAAAETAAQGIFREERIAPRLPATISSDRQAHLAGLLRNVPAGESRDSSTETATVDRFLESARLPPHQLLIGLASLYFKYVNAWMPLLQEQSISRLLRNPQALGEPELVLLHGIAISGLRYWNDSISMRKRYYETSKQRILLYALKHANIRGLQALAILTLDALGDADPVEGMNLLALMAQQFLFLGLGVEHRFNLGLNLEAPAGLTLGSMLPHPKTWAEEEEVRRLFWLVYSIDRYINTSTSSDFKVDEKTINRPLPCRYELWIAGEPVETRWYRTDKPFEMTTDNPQNLGSFSYFCEVAKLMTSIHQFAKQPLDFSSPTDINHWKARYAELDGHLSFWLNSLPGEFTEISATSRSGTPSTVADWITLQSGFILAAVRLHALVAYPPMTSELFKASHSALGKCMAAATSLRRTAQDVISAGMLQYLGPPFAGAVWVVARLLLAHASVPEHRLDPSIYFFINTLNQIGERWSLASVFAHRLTCLLPAVGTSDKQNTLESFRKYVFSVVEALIEGY